MQSQDRKVTYSLIDDDSSKSELKNETTLHYLKEKQ